MSSHPLFSSLLSASKRNWYHGTGTKMVPWHWIEIQFKDNDGSAFQFSKLFRLMCFFYLVHISYNMWRPNLTFVVITFHSCSISQSQHQKVFCSYSFSAFKRTEHGYLISFFFNEDMMSMVLTAFKIVD